LSCNARPNIWRRQPGAPDEPFVSECLAGRAALRQRDAIDLDALQAAFLKSESNVPGYQYNVVEADGRSYFRCFGGRESDVMVFVEWVDRPTARAGDGAKAGSVAGWLAKTFNLRRNKE
jgi:hypothetical protein